MRSATVLPGSGTGEAAGSDKLKVAYQVFKDEAAMFHKYAHKTVSTMAGRDASGWKMLFTKVVFCCASCTAGSRSATGKTP